MGQGAYASGPLISKLELQESGGVHRAVCPSGVMPIAGLQSELANTQSLWTIEEP
jgi:hypothetical protein